MNETDKDLVDRLLNDKSFRRHAEADIGPVGRVEVDWENNEVRFFGLRGNRSIDLQAMIATLRGQIS
jgi:hypothetical protein